MSDRTRTFPVPLPEGFDVDELRSLVPADMWEKDEKAAAVLALRRSGKFNEEWYLNRYPDVKDSGMGVIEHYVYYGAKEGRYLFNLSSSFQGKTRVIVSLTSYGKRIETVNQTIKSLLNQTVDNYYIILWLAYDDFKNREKDLPYSLLGLRNSKFDIMWTSDFRSYKKLVPVMQKYPNDIIITADDDIYYDNDWIEKLLIEYNNHPYSICCHRAHRINLDKDLDIMAYKQWSLEYKFPSTSFLNFATGVSGVLYPPYSLHKEVFNKKIFMELCPHADDIWFWAMAVLNNRKIHITNSSNAKLNFVEGTQEAKGEFKPLWMINYIGNKNDIQIKGILNQYPEIKNKIRQEFINNIPQVSIIVPIFNTGIYLEDCLESLISQEFQDIEILCINDGSTDEVTNILLDKYIHKDIRIVCYKQKNKGPGAARNFGLRKSRGKYVLFIDSDDYISKNYVGDLYLCAEKNKADIVGTNSVMCFSENGNIEHKDCGLMNNNYSYKEICNNALIKTGVSCNKLYLKKFLALNRINYLEVGACPCEDNYFTIKCLVLGHNNFYIENKAKYFYRQYKGSLTKKTTNFDVESLNYVYESVLREINKFDIADKKYWTNTIIKRAIKDYNFTLEQMEEIKLKFKISKILKYNIDICCITDNNGILPTLVMLNSIKKSQSVKTKINIYVIGVDLDKKNKIKLFSVSGNDFDVHIVDEKLSNYEKLYKNKEHGKACMATPAALIKFIIPNLFRKLDRIIYIDIDVIVLKDLVDLYQSSLDEEYLAAVVDLWSSVKEKEVSIDSYFNSGVMVLNLRKMREDKISDKLINEKLITDNLSLMDQDIFNKVCSHNFLPLDLKYNFLPICYSRHKDRFNLKIINNIYKSKFTNIEDLKKDVSIVHFAGSDKPWKNTNVMFYEKWKFFYDQII